ncbi:MAG: type 2 isopentenyl-diphosphate Delta-isomerase [Parcubacteria group bacterium]|nr:type 2 isopentenyl-diphosphate Delta-isomerase [Parcubacteria group bacterium]
MSLSERKKHHIDICLSEEVDTKQRYFDDLFFENNALPEINFDEISAETIFLGKKISAPLIIGSMTGGTQHGETINANLAQAAEKLRLPMGVGSQRIMLEKEDAKKTFAVVRKFAPTIPVFANLGAVQLNYGVTLEDIKKIIDIVKADALCFHLNPLQEAVQFEGDKNYFGLLEKMERVVAHLDIPFMAKEVGAGISRSTVKRLKDIGISIIDVSGSGGTSWAWIEGKRRSDYRDIGETFRNFGIPTPIAVLEASRVSGVDVIAGGGVRTGLDIAKCIALGAKYASCALPFLQSAVISHEQVMKTIERLILELKITMFATGSKDLKSLGSQQLYSHHLCRKRAVKN